MISIELPLAPLKFPSSVNVYLLEGEPLTLVDTGLRSEETWRELIEQLKNHGVLLTDLKQVVITHGHIDHYGLAARIIKKSGAKLLAHTDTVPWLRLDKPDWHRQKAFIFETLLKAGAPKASLSRRMEQYNMFDELAEPAEVTQLVSDSFQVTHGLEVWEVVELPGHAPGLIGLYRPKTGDLITSDHLLLNRNTRPGLIMPRQENRERIRTIQDYITSLERVANMDTTSGWPSHGAVIPDVRELTLNWLDKNLQQASMVIESLIKGEKTAYQIWHDLFPRILPFDPINGLTEVIIYLDLHELEGKVQKFSKDGLNYYRVEN